MERKPLFQRQRIFPYADFVKETERYTWRHLSEDELKTVLARCLDAGSDLELDDGLDVEPATGRDGESDDNFPRLYSLLKEVVFRCCANRAVFQFCGLETACIEENSSAEERKAGYAADVVYLTVKQAGFDYLRNFLCTQKGDYLPITFDAAIVDEADSILIDEARIPLVIAGDAALHCGDAKKIDRLVAQMKPDTFSCLCPSGGGDQGRGRGSETDDSV